MNASSLVCVAKIFDHFAALHIDGGKRKFISPQLESKISTARDAAIAYAKEKGIAFDERLYESNRPVYTITKDKDGLFYPVALYSDRALILRKMGSTNLGATQETARALAWGISINDEYLASVNENLR